MKRRRLLLELLILLMVFLGSCNEHIEEKVFVVNIIDGDKPLQEYLQYHKNVWPEVEAGFKKAGYKKIALYAYDHTIDMSLVVPAGADLAEMGKTAESFSPRCAEWNKLMAGYQKGVQGTKPGQTWVEVQPIYQFKNQ